MPTRLTTEVPLRRLTRLLAEMQTTINAAGLRAFDGDMDRFVIFALILREGLPGTRERPISAHSLSISLQRSFETVRRHINALIASGYCVRVRGGVVAAPEAADRPEIRELIRLANDCFVRFVEDLRNAGLRITATRAMTSYDPAIGVSGAVDVMLTTVETNRGLHGDWLDLALFSTVLCANAYRYDALGGDGSMMIDDRHAVRPSVIARVLGLPETTVRRRMGRLTATGGAMTQVRRGLLVSQDWLATPQAAATTAATLAGVRREIARAVARGFPIDTPTIAYVDQRPPAPNFA